MINEGLDSSAQWLKVIGHALLETLGLDFLSAAAVKLPPVARTTLRPKLGGT